MCKKDVKKMHSQKRGPMIQTQTDMTFKLVYVVMEHTEASLLAIYLKKKITLCTKIYVQ